MAKRRPAHETIFDAFKDTVVLYNKAPSFPCRAVLRIIVALLKITLFPPDCLSHLLSSVRGVRETMLADRTRKAEAPNVAKLRAELDQLVEDVIADLEARLNP
mgnify:CR=1 FL=1